MNRIDVVSADVTHESMGGTYDLVVLRAFIQVISRNLAQRALQNIAAHMDPGASLFVLGWVLDNTRISPMQAIWFNMRAINIYEQGEAYTEQEYRAWLADAGFVGFERHPQPDGTSIVIAQQPNGFLRFGQFAGCPILAPPAPSMPRKGRLSL